MSFTRRILESLLFAGSLALVGCADPLPSTSVLVTGERGITAIATDDFFVYYAKIDGSVMRVSRDGGTPTLVVSGQHAPGAVAVDEKHVYWSNEDGEIGRATKDGGTVESLVQAGHQSAFAVDASHIYFTTVEGTVQKRSKEDGSTTALAADQKVRTQFAVSGSSLVFATPSESGGAVNEMLTSSGAVDTLVSGQHGPNFVAISPSNIYWTNTGDQTVGVAQRDGSNVFQIPALGAQPSIVMGDDTYVYFADRAGAVNVAAIHGGDAVQLAKGPSLGKVSLTMDRASIYWANSEDGAILTLPRQ